MIDQCRTPASKDEEEIKSVNVISGAQNDFNSKFREDLDYVKGKKISNWKEVDAFMIHLWKKNGHCLSVSDSRKNNYS